MDQLKRFDLYILEFIDQNCHNDFLNSFMPFVTSLGNVGFIWAVIAISLLVNKKHRKVGSLLSIALMVCAILGEGIIKNIIERDRPFIANTHLTMLIPKPPSFSFPSGHSAASFAAAWILGKAFKNYRVYVYLLAILIAFSRIYLSVHYPTDVIGGIILGIVCSKLVIYVARRQGYLSL